MRIPVTIDSLTIMTLATSWNEDDLERRKFEEGRLDIRSSFLDAILDIILSCFSGVHVQDLVWQMEY